LILFTPKLRKLLGIPKKMNVQEMQIRQHSIEFVANSKEMTVRPQSISIYSDIVNYSRHGNTETCMLRTFLATNGKTGAYIFTHPYFIPLTMTDLGTIRVYIKDTLNNTIPFKTGTSHVTLQFRTQ
jgi:hypothetical protein